jgi:LL-diaminopimelate aminotransferase
MGPLVETLRAAGFDARKPKGSFFLYVPSPKAARLKDGRRVEFRNAEEATEWLLMAKLISTVPWDEACASLRFSVTFAANGPTDEKRVMAELSRRLSDVQFEF